MIMYLKFVNTNITNCNFSVVGHKDELITFCGEKVKGESHIW